MRPPPPPAAAAAAAVAIATSLFLVVRRGWMIRVAARVAVVACLVLTEEALSVPKALGFDSDGFSDGIVAPSLRGAGAAFISSAGRPARRRRRRAATTTEALRRRSAIEGALSSAATPASAFASDVCVRFAAPLPDGDAEPSKGGDSGNEGSDSGGVEFDMAALARRIEAISSTEQRLSTAFEDGLRRRARDLAKADALEAEAEAESESGRNPIRRLPVLDFDAILPGQRLSGSSEDPTFSRLLRELGLGGSFVMISLNRRERKLRRSGTICRIELVDVDRTKGPADPTAVAFAVVGRRRCRVVGPPTGMTARVGRWRRGYDPDGEEPRLGWGTERFVDMAEGYAEVSTRDDCGGAVGEETALPTRSTEWSSCRVQCNLEEDGYDGDDSRQDNGESSKRDDRKDVATWAESLVPLLDRWIELASDPRTYDNVDVVASARRRKGEPGLRIDPARLVRGVLSDLGARPSPSKDPTALALWGAALINPLPPLGAAPEIRGMMLEATNARRRLKILEWGLRRSIGNLEGTSPL